MIKVNKIDPPKLDLYAPDGTHLGEINEYEFLDARVQIKEEQKFGYYIIFKNEKVRLDRNGELESYPPGLLSIMTDYYMKLL